jgi:hypothetical protein
MVGGK